MIIYKITNKINGKIYIGQTVQPLTSRWSGHCNKSISKNGYLYNAIVKYGKENFTIEKIRDCENIDEMNFWEEELIKSENTRRSNGYNIKAGGNNHLWDDQSKMRMSETRSGENHPLWGKHHSEESRQKNSDSQKGNKSAWFGKKHSVETKNRMSQASVGKSKTPEHVEKIMQKRRKPVCGFNETEGTGWFFRSGADAEKFGFNKGGISKCCLDSHRFHKNHRWFFFEEGVVS